MLQSWTAHCPDVHLAEHSPVPYQGHCSTISSRSRGCHFPFESRYCHTLLPLAKGPPPPHPELLAQLSSATAVQTWLTPLRHHTCMMLQQVTTRSRFEEGALVLILSSVVYMPDKPHFIFAAQECTYLYTSKTRKGSPASTKPNNFFFIPMQLLSGSPLTPQTAPVVGSSPGNLKARARLQSIYKPYFKSRSDIQ